MMHSFSIEADPATGEWHLATARYLGRVLPSTHYAKRDDARHHYDSHDGGALDQAFWIAAADYGVAPATATVALTVIWC